MSYVDPDHSPQASPATGEPVPSIVYVMGGPHDPRVIQLTAMAAARGFTIRVIQDESQTLDVLCKDRVVVQLNTVTYTSAPFDLDSCPSVFYDDVPPSYGSPYTRESKALDSIKQKRGFNHPSRRAPNKIKRSKGR